LRPRRPRDAAGPGPADRRPLGDVVGDERAEPRGERCAQVPGRGARGRAEVTRRGARGRTEAARRSAVSGAASPAARRRAGAVGLLQLMPDTAEEEARGLSVARPLDLSDPETNLRLGARHLARLLEDFEGDEALALAAYNAGKAPALRWRLRAADADGAGV